MKPIKRDILLIISLMITLLVYSILRVGALSIGSEYDVDVFYHIKMADFYPSVCMNKEFAWTQLSVWKDHFCDKELGFHAILAGLRHFESLCNISFLPPFNFINIFFVSFLLILTLFCCYKSNISTCYLVSPLLIFISPLFLLRINMIRPHLISIILFILVSFLLISSIKIKWKCLLIFFSAWSYVIFYSVPHLIFIPIFSFIFTSVMLERREFNLFFIPVQLIFFAFAGILVGLVIHPQFPNSLIGWYTQGVLVISKILGYNTANVWLASELQGPNVRTILENSSIFILFLVTFILFLLDKKKRFSVLYFLVVELTMLIGFFYSERCLEYVVPAGVLGFVFQMHFCLEDISNRFMYNRFYMHCALLAVCMIVLILVFPLDKRYLSYGQFRPCYSFGLWASKNLTPGTYIGQIRWGEFPRLFYVAPQFRYSMAMDPMFSYIAYPHETVKLEEFRMLKKPLLPQELKNILGTNFVFISRFDPAIAKHLIANGGKILYCGYDGWLLLL